MNNLSLFSYNPKRPLLLPNPVVSSNAALT